MRAKTEKIEIECITFKPYRNLNKINLATPNLIQ